MKKFKFDAEILTKIPFIIIGVPLDIRELSAHENKTIDFIIRNLPADNDRYYIEHEEGFNRFKILKDSQQKEKDRLFKLILNMEQKMSRSGSKLEKVELK